MELTKDADGVLNQWSYLNEKVINNMKNCKVIATYGIGVDKIDVEAASKKESMYAMFQTMVPMRWQTIQYH